MQRQLRMARSGVSTRPASSSYSRAARLPAHIPRHSRPICQATSTETGVREAKAALLQAVSYTRRGSQASSDQRGMIEELQVALEAYQGGTEVDYSLLGGLWELQYTTATDVLPIIAAEEKWNFPLAPAPVQVGGIYQRFTSPVDGQGSVQNIIEFSVPFLLEEKKGIKLTVDASYDVRSGHRIRLVFDSANVSDVRISEGFEALLAPAMLPRNSLQQALLLAIKQFKVQFPFRSLSQIAEGVEARTGRAGSGGGSFLITYLDEELLIGRASELAGIFILKRVPDSKST